MTSRSIAALLALVVLPLAGCLTNGGTGSDALPDPSTLEVPTWEIGQEWHYEGSDGRWYNWTVVGQETKEGFETYRVRVNLSRPDTVGGAQYRTLTRWFDKTTLGLVAEERAGWSSYSDAPMGPLFPLESRNYTLTLTVRPPNSDSAEWTYNVTEKVEGWEDIQLESQTTHAILVKRSLQNTTDKLWYRHTHENFVKRADGDGRTLYLMSSSGCSSLD